MQLTRIVPDTSTDVFLKLEYFNPTGSYKDRMAKAMIEGAARRGQLKPGDTVVALGPAGLPVLTKGEAGPPHVEGIGVGSMPPLLEEEFYDEAIAVEEFEARAMARRLAREEGIFSGTSSSLNVTGALRLAERLGRGACVVTVAVDTGLKYLSGDLYQS